jgi:hypothetical protein
VVGRDARDLFCEHALFVRPLGNRLLLLFLAAGALLVVFTSLTVHRRTEHELRTNAPALRTQSILEYWLTHGYFDSAGLLIVPTSAGAVVYRNSTGGEFLTAFIVQKLAGTFSPRLQALHNQLLVMASSVLLAFLGFRLSRRFGIPLVCSIALALALQAVYFTFPDNLMTYWEMSARVPWLCFACLFLLLEERERPSILLQALAAFGMAYMEFVAGVLFALSYVAVKLLLDRSAWRPAWRRLALTIVAPVLLALGVFACQLLWIRAHHPELPRTGSSFAYRTGLDGASTEHYIDQLDIAFGRDTVRQGFARAGFPHVRQLFRWAWVFAAGALALLAILIAAARGKVPPEVTLVLLSLLGCYILYAAVFSQVVAIHPYFFDLLLFTPLILALFVVLPSAVESVTRQQGIVTTGVVLLAIWVSMTQLRQYALLYPT